MLFQVILIINSANIWLKTRFWENYENRLDHGHVNVLAENKPLQVSESG